MLGFSTHRYRNSSTRIQKTEIFFCFHESQPNLETDRDRFANWGFDLKETQTLANSPAERMGEKF